MSDSPGPAASIAAWNRRFASICEPFRSTSAPPPRRPVTGAALQAMVMRGDSCAALSVDPEPLAGVELPLGHKIA